VASAGAKCGDSMKAGATALEAVEVRGCDLERAGPFDRAARRGRWRGELSARRRPVALLRHVRLATESQPEGIGPWASQET
jgi:hypothetical protein